MNYYETTGQRIKDFFIGFSLSFLIFFSFLIIGSFILSLLLLISPNIFEIGKYILFIISIISPIIFSLYFRKNKKYFLYGSIIGIVTSAAALWWFSIVMSEALSFS